MTTPNENFSLLLLQGIKAAGDKPCLLSPGQQPLTYGDLQKQIAACSLALQHAGLSQGDRVLVIAPKSHTFIVLYLACLASGFIFVPVNPACTDSEAAYFVTDAAPVLVVTGPERAETMAGVTGNSLLLTMGAQGEGSLAGLCKQQSAAEPAVVLARQDDIAVIIYTSGTTGRPKGAMLSHGNLSCNAKDLSAIWQWSVNDVLIHALPVFHVHGLFVALHLPLMHGSTMHFLPGFDAHAILGLLAESTVLMGVPTFYTRLLTLDALTPTACAGMRLFISGSAPLLPATFQAFRKRSGHAILERYGMSETGILASNPLTGERQASTVGYALPGVSTRICDDQGHELPVGAIGTLEVRGANVFRGYWRNPDKTASSFHAEWFITGDLVQQSADGRLSIVGRGRDMVISGGLNVYPREVEAVLDALPEVSESAVIGVPHPDLGEAVVAVLALRPGFDPQHKKTLSSAKARLSSYKIPKKLIFVEFLPKNTMGKVQKSVLRDRYQQIFS